MEKLVQQIIAWLATVPWPKNWVLKLLSLFFAFFLWYFVVGEDKVDMNVLVPVEIVNLPRDLVISNQFKKQLEVMVSGQRSLIKGITNQNITRVVDLSDAKPGKVEVHNEPESIELPRGIDVLRVQPSSITLLLDKLIQKRLTTKAVVIGQPAEGYKLAAVTLEPDHIAITGPLSVLEDEEYIETNLIDISNLKASTIKQPTLNLKPAIADLIGEQVVTAHITIADTMVQRQISNVPIAITGPGVDETGAVYQLTPETVRIKAELPWNLLKETDDLRTLFTALVDIGQLSSGRHELEVQVKPAPGVQVISLEPEKAVLVIPEQKKLKIKNPPVEE